jgi:hypothetical protein
MENVTVRIGIIGNAIPYLLLPMVSYGMAFDK